MRVGVAIPTYDLETGRPLPLRQVAEQAQRAEALGFHSAWVMDHLWLERDGVRVGAHEPNVTLGYIAALTSTITLGVLVLGNAFRPLSQLARETAALADALPGRFVLGLGCGSQPAEHRAFGLPFERRVGRLESTLRALPPLLRGERLDRRDDFIDLDDASILTTRPAPPIWVAGFGPRMLRITAAHADGWNSAWHGPDHSTFASQLAVVRRELAAAGRTEGAFEVTAGLAMLPLEGEALERAAARADGLRPRTAGPSWPSPARERMITGGPEQLAEAVRRYEAIGATHVILNLSPSPFGLLDPALPERAAAMLGHLA
ncbi:MAG TPA: LLM class flavin-dependent oxidoreductase [Candidatus Dormibacteraeota bacterium]|jgi:alkanesulfonate monooxygenase SsuD/methylene tetrahydromethanopterin reductase-like flavin-dependent oxidoreductase (luciferase family)|nr:LLM class flavin-dependent oxidoreductase [Candidatus Dormibacteraeota bacterium]